MAIEEVEAVKASLAQVGKVCKYICVATKIVFAVFCMFWVLAACSIVLTFFNSDLSDGASNVFTLILHFARGAVVVVLFSMLIKIFSETACGMSPFTLIQVRRLRTIALILVVYAILGVVLMYFSALLQMGGISVGYVSSTEYSNAIIPIDFTPVVAAAIVFAFSFVFKYGVLLQKYTDETL